MAPTAVKAKVPKAFMKKKADKLKPLVVIPLGKGKTTTKKVFKKTPKSQRTNKKEPKAVVPRKQTPYGRLWAKAIFTGYKRGQRNQHPNHALLQLEGCRNKKNATFYVGKRCVFVFKGKNKTPNPTNRKTKNTIRAIWGKVTRTHGDNGVVRARFKRNLPGYAIGRRVRIMLYPSRI